MSDVWEIIPGLIQILFLSLILALSTYMFKKKKSTSTVLKVISELKYSKTAIHLPTVHRYEIGRIHISGFIKSSELFPSIIRVKWMGMRTFQESSVVDLNDLCFETPVLTKVESSYNITMPAIRLTSGDLRDLIVSCLNTQNIHGYGFIHRVYPGGYVRTELDIKPSTMRIRVEWLRSTQGGEIKPGRERLIVEYCIGRRRGICMKLLELSKPSIEEHKVTYPVVKKIFLGYIDGSGFRDLGESITGLPSVLGVRDAYLRVFLRDKWRTIIREETRIT